MFGLKMGMKIFLFTLLLLSVTVDLARGAGRGVAMAERRSVVGITEANDDVLGHSYGQQDPEINNHHNIPRESWPENGQTPTSPSSAFKKTAAAAEEKNG